MLAWPSMHPTSRNLPRLEQEAYRGLTAVHWTFGIEDRAKGWLNAGFYNHFREVLVHMNVRHGCVTPAYCLMPDHLHIMLWGIREEAHLYLAAKFLRKHTARKLRPALYQKQAYDHILRKKEYERGGFEAVCFYILQNPVRAELCKSAEEYAFSGCVIPGYPDLDIHAEKYWELFWKTLPPPHGGGYLKSLTPPS